MPPAAATRRICVTGAAGTLGRRILRALEAGGDATIVALDRVVPAGRSGSHGTQWIEADLEDVSAVQRAVAGCDVVVHLAALVDASDSLSRPVPYFQTNVLGTIHVLEACRQAVVPRVIYVSTAHVYGRPARVPVDESDPVAPESPYAASKRSGEVAVESYAASFGLACDVLRLTNIYGPGCSERTMAGLAFVAARRGGPIALRSLAPVRDFLYVDDAAEAVHRIALTPGVAGVCRTTNVGTGIGVSVGRFAVAVADAARAAGLGRPAVQETSPDWQDPIPEFVVDVTRLRNLTGWTPSTSVAEGVALTIVDGQLSMTAPG